MSNAIMRSRPSLSCRLIRSAALALTVLFYSIYVGFQTLKPNTNRKKALVAPMQRLAPAITIA